MKTFGSTSTGCDFLGVVGMDCKGVIGAGDCKGIMQPGDGFAGTILSGDGCKGLMTGGYFGATTLGGDYV